MYEKQYKRDPGNQELLDKISYASVPQLKNVIRHIDMFDNSDNFKDICVLTDIKTALGLYEKDKDNRVLTEKQKLAIVGHLVEDKKQSEVALELDISQQGVSLLINSGLRRIQKFLTKKEISWIPWTVDEKIKLIENYPVIGPDKTAELLGKPKQKTISMYHALINIRNNKEA